MFLIGPEIHVGLVMVPIGEGPNVSLQPISKTIGLKWCDLGYFIGYHVGHFH